MQRFLPPRAGYSRAERLSDAAVHVSGLAAALLGAPALIALAVIWRGDGAAIAAAVIYGVTLIAMILFSALCNMVDAPGWSVLWKRLDHSAIYAKIAGTFSAFVLLSGQGLALMAALWAAAVCGMALRVLSPDRFRWLAVSLYLAMGWAGAAFGWPVFAGYSGTVLGLIAAGGVLYTIGTGFFLLDRLPFHNTIWHVFVLTATVILYVAVMMHLAETSALEGG
ncbi:Hly-III family protein [Cereibacter changlensis]|uniref:Hly-III family protein n=1 Tax=Cereibacter changlensis TaxID=402884 RepID=A0A4U0YZF8_9RHOB|nr:hemolysin III family protein [Cereibacter changlensis]TKA95381.1 Hly-III family protein [Cereibacter changlensis]